MKKISVLLIVLFLACMSGCSDEETVEPESNAFSVNLEVTDTDGEPAEGLEATVHVFLPPELMPGRAKPSVGIPFYLPVDAHVSLVAYDLDGNVVRTILDETISHGSRMVMMTVDEAGNPLIGTHLYRCEMVATVEGVEEFRSETFVTLYTSIDSRQRPIIGTTDNQGRITYTKRTEFPYLYNPGPQMAMDDMGLECGSFEFIDQVEITLRDPNSELYLTLPVVIGQGSNTVDLVWDQALATKAESQDDSRSAPMVEATCQAKDSNADVQYSLGPAYPNPFN